MVGLKVKGHQGLEASLFLCPCGAPSCVPHKQYLNNKKLHALSKRSRNHLQITLAAMRRRKTLLSPTLIKTSQNENQFNNNIFNKKCTFEVPGLPGLKTK